MRDAERAQLASELLTVGRRLGAEPLPQLPAAGVDPQLPAGLRVDEPEVADIRQLLLPLIADLDRDDVVARREVEQPGPPVAGAAEVGDDHDHGAAACEPADPRQRGARATSGRRARGRARAAARQEREEAAVPLAGRRGDGIAVAERRQCEAVAATEGEVPDGERDSLGDVPLPPVGGAERHRRRRVEQEPRLDRPLGDVDPNVRLAGASGDVPVDQADVVARRRTAAPGPARCRRRVAHERWSPASSPSIRRRTVRFTLRRSAAGTGPGPGRPGVLAGRSAWTVLMRPPAGRGRAAASGSSRARGRGSAPRRRPRRAPRS